MLHRIALHLLVSLTITTVALAGNKKCPDYKYSSGEHKQLGDNGFLKACANTNLINLCSEFKIPRADGDFNYSYGDVVALGDYFSNADRAYKNKINIDSADQLFRCIDKQGRVQYKQKTHPEVNYPTCYWAIAVSSQDYLKLASTNEDHFAWDNILAYIYYHEKALALATSAHLNKDFDQFKKALFYNGFADHFLTDSFAAGHVRVPRRQVLNWTKDNVDAPLKHFVSDALAMILHNYDGKTLSGKEIGVLVRNSRGDEWTTHSDEEMNTCRPDTDPSIRLPTTAVELSVNEIFQTFNTGEIPSGVFSALRYAPFPTQKLPLDQIKLTGSYAKNEKIFDKLENSLPSPLKMVLPKSALSRMMWQLLEIRRQFAIQNQADLMANPHLQLRMPAEFIEAYTN